MLLVVGLEMFFNAMTWMRVARARPETNLELFGQLWVDLGALSALLFLSGGATNPFVTLYLPSLAIAAAVLPWTLMVWLALFAVACYALLSYNFVPLNIENPANLFDYFRTGLWVNFMVSVGLIGWFVARMSRALRPARRRARRRPATPVARRARRGAGRAGRDRRARNRHAAFDYCDVEPKNCATPHRNDKHLAPYAADFELLEQQMTLCTSALARLRSRASGPSNRQPLDDWLEASSRNGGCVIRMCGSSNSGTTPARRFDRRLRRGRPDPHDSAG